MKKWKKKIVQFFRYYGYDIIKYNPTTHPLARRKKLLEQYNIQIVLDVGANIGTYGQQMRELGYKGEIISFEPLSSAYNKFKETIQGDNKWKAMNYAIGKSNINSIINISANSYSSSILDMLPSHLKSAPESKYIGKENIKIKTLDSIFDQICAKDMNIWLKIDTQGFEMQVIDGARNSLNYIDTIQIEMSLMPLYKDMVLFDKIYEILYQKGYRLVSIEPGFSDKETGQLLQFDGIFHRI